MENLTSNRIPGAPNANNISRPVAGAAIAAVKRVLTPSMLAGDARAAAAFASASYDRYNRLDFAGKQEIWFSGAGHVTGLAITSAVGGEAISGLRLSSAAERGLGSISVPSNLKYGTTLFGQEAHVQAGALLQARLEAQGVTGVMNRTGPGLTGVDMSVDSIAARRLGFEHIEIKPNTASGLKTFNTQVGKWGYDPATVRAVTYDAQGNLRWGFDF